MFSFQAIETMQTLSYFYHISIHGINLAIRPYLAKTFKNDSVWQIHVFFSIRKIKVKKIMASRMQKEFTSKSRLPDILHCYFEQHRPC